METFQTEAKIELLNKITNKMETPVVEKPRPRRNEMSEDQYNELVEFKKIVEDAGENANYLMANNSYPNINLAKRDL